MSSPPCRIDEGVPKPSPIAPSVVAGAVQDRETLKPDADPAKSVGPGTTGGAEGVAQAKLDTPDSEVPSTCVTR